MNTPAETIELPGADEILVFLKEAHAHGWPDGLMPSTKPELHGFEEVRFRNSSWEYLDTYGGDTTDVGFEIIFYKEKLVWGTSYRGGAISASIGAVEIFAFLVEALKAPNSSELPLRGPEVYQSADLKWLYRFRIYGEFRSFIAIEQILFESDLVYERTLIGGCCGDSRLYGPPIPLYKSLFHLLGK